MRENLWEIFNKEIALRNLLQWNKNKSLFQCHFRGLLCKLCHTKYWPQHFCCVTICCNLSSSKNLKDMKSFSIHLKCMYTQVLTVCSQDYFNAMCGSRKNLIHPCHSTDVDDYYIRWWYKSSILISVQDSQDDAKVQKAKF